MIDNFTKRTHATSWVKNAQIDQALRTRNTARILSRRSSCTSPAYSTNTYTTSTLQPTWQAASGMGEAFASVLRRLGKHWGDSNHKMRNMAEYTVAVTGVYC
jgi:hypothetical protein